MMHRSALLGLALAAGVFAACGPDVEVPGVEVVDEDSVGETQSALRTGGDPALGKHIVLNNGPPFNWRDPYPADPSKPRPIPYLSCGLPEGVVTVLSWADIDVIGTGPTVPGRVHDESEYSMANLPYYVSTTPRPNGVKVITSNCLLCHASKLGDNVILGLPNSGLDFSQDETFFGLIPFALDGISLGLNQAENVELARYRRLSTVASKVPPPDTRGVNPADVTFGVIAAHRNKETLAWSPDMNADATLDKLKSNLAYTDVPAWWNMKYKKKMFFSGIGGGDHARIMMSASLICLDDVAEAKKIDSYFHHVEAFIKTLPSPKYTEVAKLSINSAAAARGRTIFTTDLPGQPAGTKCVGCHGDPETFRDSDPNNDKYPADFIPAGVVGTDRLYADHQANNSAVAYYFNYFNSTWFGQSNDGNAAVVTAPAAPGYVPPSLVGVWATAPYFHNASVPTLAGVLNPALRPKLYRRTFDPALYDFGGTKTPPAPLWNGKGEIGWPYEPVLFKIFDTSIYDTSKPGYGNQGHTFAASLTDAKRKDLLEYLKTL